MSWGMIGIADLTKSSWRTWASSESMTGVLSKTFSEHYEIKYVCRAGSHGRGHLPVSWQLQKHHYQDLPDPVKRHLGSLPDGFLAYFTRRFPGLFLHVHGVIRRCGLARESMFRSYFELADP